MSAGGLAARPEGFRRVAALPGERGHPHAPVFLAVAARAAQEAAGAPLLLIDRELFRFDAIWAAAGHPNGVLRASPEQLAQLSGAPVADVVLARWPDFVTNGVVRPATRG